MHACIMIIRSDQIAFIDQFPIVDLYPLTSARTDVHIAVHVLYAGLGLLLSGHVGVGTMSALQNGLLSADALVLC